MNRRTFLSALAGLPFVGLVKGNEPVALENIPPLPMPGFVEKCGSMSSLVEYAIKHAKGKLSADFVRLFIGSEAFKILLGEGTLLNGMYLKHGYPASLIFIEPHEAYEFGRNMYLFVANKSGTVMYEIWPVENRGIGTNYILEHKLTNKN